MWSRNHISFFCKKNRTGRKLSWTDKSVFICVVFLICIQFFLQFFNFLKKNPYKHIAVHIITTPPFLKISFMKRMLLLYFIFQYFTIKFKIFLMYFVSSLKIFYKQKNQSNFISDWFFINSVILFKQIYHWWLQLESNQWHEDFQSSALPTELWSHNKLLYIKKR